MFMTRDRLMAQGRLFRDSEVVKTFMSDLASQLSQWLVEQGLSSKKPLLAADAVAGALAGSQFGVFVVDDPVMPDFFFLRYDVEADFREHGVLVTLVMRIRDSSDNEEVSTIPRLVIHYSTVSRNDMMPGIVTRLREVFEVPESATSLPPGTVRSTLDALLSSYMAKCIP